MTEDDARKRWCPFAVSRVIISGPETMTAYACPGDGNKPVVTCLASECMAWRWRTVSGPEQHGYCGLVERQ